MLYFSAPDKSEAGVLEVGVARKFGSLEATASSLEGFKTISRHQKQEDIF